MENGWDPPSRISGNIRPDERPDTASKRPAGRGNTRRLPSRNHDRRCSTTPSGVMCTNRDETLQAGSRPSQPQGVNQLSPTKI